MCGVYILKDDKRIYIMAEEVPYKAVLKMGIPVTMGMLFMVLYNVVDTYFIGMLGDDYQLAATNLSYPVMMVIIAVSGIVGNGGASYIARCIGGEKYEEANHTLTLGFEMIFISSIFISIIGIVCINPIVNGLGADDNTFDHTKNYVLIMLAGCFFTMGNYAFGQLLRSEGSTFYSMIGMIAGTVANIVFDPVFIFVFGLEIKGAAIATVLGNVIGVCIFISFYLKKKTLLCPSLKQMKFDKVIVKEIFWVGIPHTFEQLFTTTAMIVMNNLAASYGALTVAAMGISNKIMSFGNYIYQGIAAGCQPLMGYNYGSKNFSRLRHLIISGTFVISIIEICIMVLFGIFAPVLVSLFTDSQIVIDVGAKTLRSIMLVLPFVGTISIVRNTFNSIGKPMFAFGITVFRQVILYIPCMLLFNKAWGYSGLIHAQPVSEAVCMAFSMIILLRAITKFAEKTIK